MTPKPDIRKAARLPLAFIPPGQEVRLAGFGDEIDALQREQLTAYGLAESRPLKAFHYTQIIQNYTSKLNSRHNA